jgi:tetratricopeptide (TPR) repeat protein
VTLAGAEALLAVGRVDDARRQAVAVLAKEPENVEALCLLARCHQEADDYPPMLRAAEDALQVAPDEFQAHLLRSQALLQLDRYDEAVEAGANAVRLAEESAAAYVTYGCALFAANQRRRGWAALREAARLAPDWPTVHFVTGAIWHSTGHSRRARQAYERTLRLEADHEGARQGLGQLAMTGGRLGTAIGHLGSVAGSPRAESAAPGVDRALRGVTGQALAIAWLVGLALMFAQYPVAWAVAAVPVAGYALWVRRVARSLPPNVAAGVRLRLQTDPRLRWRIGLAVAILGWAVAAGVYLLLNPVWDSTDPRPLVFLFVMIGWLVVGTVAVFVVDQREARRLRPDPGTKATDPSGAATAGHLNPSGAATAGRLDPSGAATAGHLDPSGAATAGHLDPSVAELAISELAELESAALGRRWLGVTGVVLTVPWLLAAPPAASWGTRAITGAITMALLLGYYRWSAWRWTRRAANRSAAKPWALPLVRAGYLLLGAMWIGLPVIAFWPGEPPEIVVVWLFVAIAGAVIAIVVSALVSIIRWVARLSGSRSTVDEQ